MTNVFNATGIKGVLQSTPDGDLLTGYFPCDKPPTVGFSFPSTSNAAAAGNDSTSLVSKKGSIFNIPTDQWAAVNNGNNNCTAVLSGMNFPNVTGLWVVGQRMVLSIACDFSLLTCFSAFFQGLYIDHDLTNGMIGFAPLKKRTGPTSTSTSTSSPTSTTSTKPTQSISGASQKARSWNLFSGIAILAVLFVI